MSRELTVAVASYGPEQFSLLHDVITRLGHRPVVYLMSRTTKPHGPPENDLIEGVSATMGRLPEDVGLVLPSGPRDLVTMLSGYQIDLALIYGFNWKIPSEVLSLPRYGTINIHPSMLPRYRGPSPVPWAIRNGDEKLGLSIHYATNNFDAGPILAQGYVGNIPEIVTRMDIRQLLRNQIPDMLTQAIAKVLARDHGVAQNESLATYAPFPPAEWQTVTWQQSSRSAHHQIRVIRFLNGGQPATVTVGEREIRVYRTSVNETSGLPVECSDGPLWLQEYEMKK